MEDSLPLNLCQVKKSSLVINRLYTSLHSIALLALIFYRTSTLLEITKTGNKSMPFVLFYVLVFASELILSFIWLLNQAYLWRPVYRTVFPERLPEDDKLPAIDVFICTADPTREPSVQVMNTVISAMALDYPANKLHVYLSDDGGSPVTLGAMREAWNFARFWLPFCRKYGIQTSSPEAYFSVAGDGNVSSKEFTAEKEKIKEEYDVFKERVNKIKENATTIISKNHPSIIEVIRRPADNGREPDKAEMPLLVYVSREKRPSQPHNFKAGALNVLLRVSGLLSNSPHILALDCDMYCNDPASARQAMCFHLDSEISPKLAFVQFPHNFHNISDNDIYDSQLRTFFTNQWYGMDGITGPINCGTCFYITREALCETSGSIQEDTNVGQLRKIFGPSNEFIKSLNRKIKSNIIKDEARFSSALLQESQCLASLSYERDTQWGKEVGFRYFSVVEDYFTGFLLHCKGWNSVYYNPQRPPFLGTASTNLGEMLVQNTRWTAGLIEVAISKYSPIIYGPSRMPILACMCYAQLAYYPFGFIPFWCLSIIPQLCLAQGIPLYPEISNPFFMVFVYLFLSSNLKHIQEALSAGHSIRTWMHEQRMWMIKSVTCYFYGSLNGIMEKIGMREASFLPTDKAEDEGRTKLYKSGMFDFRAPGMFIIPMCTLVILNIVSLLIGAVKIIHTRNYGEIFIQAFISFFIIVVQYPVIEGIFFRKDYGRIPKSASLLSTMLAGIILSLGSLVLIY
ncbi:cellulose synthase-like protein G1 [Coffea eugenioides]|uniref:cellulose synthase-like protein G1 n=1 Tax=Coffea eugenioides TaxID=49369 RepID=UPI000F5CAD6B|nr:cellulose synthase-like protein G1 [Coffea arabica]XP_027165343.1 cellulose synthase-like protein G1 [Coffea eugenioides]